MKAFTTYLTEAAASEEKLTHLEHNEDHIIHSGNDGYQHAVANLRAVHDKLTGKDNDVDVQVKHDGSPSVIFGTHPENGKFFVSTKSAFNKQPKINYDSKDVQENHGHAPGLVNKLNAALEHLPKVTPKKGVFQGDIMYTRDQGGDDVAESGGKFHFTPNTIKYSTPTDSDEGKKIAKAKFGVLVHTGYKGDTFEDMKADYTPDKSAFKKHKDVHLFDNSQDFGNTTYTDKQQNDYHEHMLAADKSQDKTDLKAIAPHEEHLKTYINQTVKEDSAPTVEGYQDHLQNKYNKRINDLKTEGAKTKKREELNGLMSDVKKSNSDFENAFETHHHLQQAKHTLIDALGTHQRYEHSIGGEASKPEGYVIVRNNRPSKLIDRPDFSRKNFQLSANR